MQSYRYVIVGGGMTADAAVSGIREVDAEGTIAVMGEERHPPYARPPLSKGLWKGEAEESIWLKTNERNASIHVGRRIVTLDAGRKQLTDDYGEVYSYDKLLLATGGRARRFSFDHREEVVYFRSVDDYAKLRKLCQRHMRFTVVGGGFIGSEIAAALAINRKQVTLVCPGAGIGSRAFPSELVDYLNKYYRQQGVEVVTGERVVGMESESNTIILATDSGRLLPTEVVVAGIGIEPNVELAVSAGLKVDNGIRVDGALHTSRDDVFAAGDVASFFNPALDRYIRVEHEDNARTMGRSAGHSMAGKTVLYDHLPFFYSDLFDLGYEAVGEIDSRLEMVVDWKRPFREGTIYYMKAGRVRGVLLWNVWGELESARHMISDPVTHTPEELLVHLEGPGRG